MRVFYFLIFFGLSTLSCTQLGGQTDYLNPKDGQTVKTVQTVSKIDTNGMTIETRFPAPGGFIRQTTDSLSYTHFLRNLKLFQSDHLVNYYDGRTKDSTGIYCAVVDLPIGQRDRHQCADAVMNVRAHYLYSIQEFDRIHFNFTNGFVADYNEWRKGKRIRVSGNNVSWYQTDKESKNYESLLDYLQNVYSYAGTYSLDMELKEISKENMQPGDVFIFGGFPGHAVIVLDVLVSVDTDEKLFLLGQSYMPAQELQILINPNNDELSPWYTNKNLNTLITPQWIFDEVHLKRFE